MAEVKDNPFAALSAYEMDHLIVHLQACDSRDILDRLMAEDAANGLQAWYDEKANSRGDLTGYARDLEIMLSAAEDYSHKRACITAYPLGVVTECRYALMLASINSLVRQVAPLLAVVATEREVWTARQALEYVRRQSDPVLRALLVTLLAKKHPDECLHLARSMASEIDAAIGKDMERYSFFGAASKVTQDFCGEFARLDNNTLSRMPWSEPVLDLIRSLIKPLTYFAESSKRGVAIAHRVNAVTARLVGNDKLRHTEMERALDISEQGGSDKEVRDLWEDTKKRKGKLLSGESLISEILSLIAPHLPEDLHEDALAVAMSIENPKLKSLALSAVYRMVSPSRLRRLLQEGMVVGDQQARVAACDDLRRRAQEIEAQISFDIQRKGNAGVWQRWRSVQTIAQECSTPSVDDVPDQNASEFGPSLPDPCWPLIDQPSEAFAVGTTTGWRILLRRPPSDPVTEAKLILEEFERQEMRIEVAARIGERQARFGLVSSLAGLLALAESNEMYFMLSLRLAAVLVEENLVEKAIDICCAGGIRNREKLDPGVAPEIAAIVYLVGLLQRQKNGIYISRLFTHLSRDHADILPRIASRLASAELYKEAVDAVMVIASERLRQQDIECLLDTISVSPSARSFPAVESLISQLITLPGNAFSRGSSDSMVVAAFNKLEAAGMIEASFQIVKWIQSHGLRARCIADLLPRLPPDVQDKAVQLIKYNLENITADYPISLPGDKSHADAIDRDIEDIVGKLKAAGMVEVSFEIAKLIIRRGSRQSRIIGLFGQLSASAQGEALQLLKSASENGTVFLTKLFDLRHQIKEPTLQKAAADVAEATDFDVTNVVMKRMRDTSYILVSGGTKALSTERELHEWLASTLGQTRWSGIVTQIGEQFDLVLSLPTWQEALAGTAAKFIEERNPIEICRMLGVFTLLTGSSEYLQRLIDIVGQPPKPHFYFAQEEFAAVFSYLPKDLWHDGFRALLKYRSEAIHEAEYALVVAMTREGSLDEALTLARLVPAAGPLADFASPRSRIYETLAELLPETLLSDLVRDTYHLTRRKEVEPIYRKLVQRTDLLEGSAKLVEQALRRVPGLTAADRVLLLGILGANSPRDIGRKLTQTAVNELRFRVKPGDRIAIVRELLPHVPQQERLRLVEDLLSEGKEVADDLLGALSRGLMNVPVWEAHPIWILIRRRLMGLTRAEFVSKLDYLSTFICMCDGPHSLIELERAIERSGQWWQ